LDRNLLSEFEYTLKDLFPKWYRVDKKFKYRPRTQYLVTNLRRPYQYLVAILCKLYGEPNATQFSLKFIPLIYFCTDVGISFNWVDILSKNITSSISTVAQAKPGTFPSFHMSSSLLDIMCTTHRYSNMGWIWFSFNASIHICCKVLWEHKYHIEYQIICEKFLAPLYEFIFCATPPCMIYKSIEVIRIIGEWYLMEHGTYIGVYDAMNLPHLLPQFVPDKLVLHKVAYPTIIHGVGGILYMFNKAIWPSLPL
jgi:hypothetical protein